MHEPRARPARAGDRRVRVDPAREERLVRLPELWPARRGERTHRRPVVGAVERDRLVPLGAAALAVVLARHLDRRLRRLRAARELLDHVVPATREPEQLVGELERPVGRRHDRRGEREPPMLRDDRVDDLVVAVAQADREHPREPVDVALPLVVCEPDPVALDDDQRVRAEGLHLVEVDHHVARGRAEVEGLDVGFARLRHRATVCLGQTSSQVIGSRPVGALGTETSGQLDLSDQPTIDRRDAGRDLPQARGPLSRP